MRWPLRSAAVWCVLVVSGLVSTAVAHEKRVARQGMVTVRAAAVGLEIDAMVVMRFGGERALGVVLDGGEPS